MTATEIKELLQTSLIEKYPWIGAIHLAMCECIIFEDKIYFPDYKYESMEIGRTPQLQNYGFPSYSLLIDILKDHKFPYPLAKKGDNIVCRCLNTRFHFSYGDYELNVNCSECGNSWTAYSG